MDSNNRRSGNENPYFAFAKYAGIGFEVAIPIILGMYAGSKLDDKYDKPPLFFLIGLFVGLAVATSIILKYSRMAAKDMKKEDDGPDSPK